MWIGKAAEGNLVNVIYTRTLYKQTVYIVILNYYIYKNSKSLGTFENIDNLFSK